MFDFCTFSTVCDFWQIESWPQIFPMSLLVLALRVVLLLRGIKILAGGGDILVG